MRIILQETVKTNHMIDLKELDKRLNEQLDKETSESLTQWLLEKRFRNIKYIIGSGTFEDLEQKVDTVQKNKVSVATSDNSIMESFNSQNNNFTLAA